MHHDHETSEPVKLHPPGPPATPPAEPPALGGVRFGPVLAGTLYILLVVSAALALWVRRAEGPLPERLETAAPWLFLIFSLLFAAYRLQLVRRRKYPTGKAFFQIGAALLFIMLLLPQNRAPYDASAANDDLDVLLQDHEPRVRALAAELAGYRSDGGRHAPALAKALNDRDERVRNKAHASLVKLRGSDLGPADDAAAVKAWVEAYP